MNVTIDISDKAIQAHIDEINEYIGIYMTPEQFISVARSVNYSIYNLQDYGFGDSMDRDSFLDNFIIDILKLPRLPTYGDKLSDDDKKIYWETLRKTAIEKGYKA